MSLSTVELAYEARTAAKLLADDFMPTTTDGTTMSKKEFLDVISNSDNPLELFEYSEMQVRVYGEAAVVSARLHEKGFMDGKPYELKARPAWTWVRQNGIWLCVAAHD